MKGLATTLTLWALLGSLAIAQNPRSPTDDDNRGATRRPRQRAATRLSDENLSKLIDHAAKLSAAIEKGDVTREQAISRFRGQLHRLTSGERRKLVSKGQEGWRYLDTRKGPPKAWTKTDFDDSKWEKGRAPLGYGEEDVATELDYGDDSDLKFPTAFFRRKFDVGEAATAEIYAGRILADDGAVIYLNGKEIKRLRIPEGEIDHDTYSKELARIEGEFVLFGIDREALVKGENVLCVSVHQAHAASSDLVFDMEVLGLSKEELAQLEKSAERGRMVDRRRYGIRRRVQVKDPADFNKSRENRLFSGPQAGEKLPPLKATGIRGETAGKNLEIIAAADGKPHVLIFQTDDGVGLRGLVGLSRLLLDLAAKSKQELRTSVVFLGDDATALSRRVKDIERHVSKDVLLGVSRDGREGPGSYGLNRNVAMTVLVAKDGKVVHSFAFQQPLLTVDAHILGAVADAIGEKRETLEKWLNEDRAGDERTRRGDTRRRERRGNAERRAGKQEARQDR